jgi:hypothetical protein
VGAGGEMKVKNEKKSPSSVWRDVTCKGDQGRNSTLIFIH